jgi:hypothetical protein
MARVTQNSTRPQPTQRTSYTRMQNTDTQAPHARTTSRTAPTTTQCAIITACTPLRARHAQHGTQLRPPHTPPTENHTQSHTRPPPTLTSELSGCPASTGCCRTVGCCTSTSTCRTHEQPSRHTMAPEAAADPSQPPTTHLSAAHNINQVKSNESQSAHCMLSLTHNTVCE